MRNAFTLIELIIVIVLLGILSAVAMPKYFDLTTDAHRSSAKAAQSALSVGIDLMHSKYLISKDKQGIGVAPSTGTWTDDYPVPGDADDCLILWQAAMSSNTTEPADGSNAAILAEGGPDFYYVYDSSLGCTYHYTGTLAVGDAISTGTFSVVYKDSGKVTFNDASTAEENAGDEATPE